MRAFLNKNKVWILCALGVVAFIWLVTFSHSFQHCECQNDDYQSTKTALIISGFIRCFFVWIASHPALIGSLSTVVIAFFTYTLYRATSTQAELTRSSLKLATNEFIATHRPKIIVHSFFGDTDFDTFIQATFTYVNAGTSDATLISIDLGVEIAGELRSGIQMNGNDLQRQILKSGEPKTHIITHPVPRNNQSTDIAWVKAIRGQSAESIYLMGRIKYEDGNGAIRETGFCRVYAPKAFNWIKTKDSYYEYSY